MVKSGLKFVNKTHAQQLFDLCCSPARSTIALHRLHIIIIDQIQRKVHINEFRHFYSNDIGPENVDIERIMAVIGEQLQSGFIRSSRRNVLASQLTEA